MTILQIEYFIEIVKCGSFTKAAEKLFISHQALSIQIQALEKELGMPLFDRSNRRKLTLLEYGEILYKSWEPMLERHRLAVEEAQNLYKKEQNTLHIGVQGVSYIRNMTIPIISKYAEKHNLKPVFSVDTPERLLSKLESGELDFCSLISYSMLGKEDILYSKEIGKKRAYPVIAVSKKNPLSKRKKLTLNDIKDERILIFNEKYASDAKARIKAAFKDAGIDSYRLVTLETGEDVKIDLCMNEGVTIMLNLALEDVLDEVKLFDFVKMKEEDMSKIVLAFKDKKFIDILDD